MSTERNMGRLTTWSKVALRAVGPRVSSTAQVELKRLAQRRHILLEHVTRFEVLFVSLGYGAKARIGPGK